MKMLRPFIVIALFVIAAPAAAETVTLRATLARTSAVSPGEGMGSGTAQFTFDTTTKQLSYSVHYSGLTGPATAADIHGPASGDGAAPIVVHFYVPDSPISGTSTLSEKQGEELLEGQFYVEVDTDAHQRGELRGQIQK